RVRLLFRPLPQHPLPGALHEDPLGAPFVPVAPRVLAALVRVGGVGAVLDRHHAEFPAYQLRRQGDEERRLAGVLASDDRHHARCRHAASARSRSAGVFTLKNSTSGSPNARTRSRGSVPTCTSAWKPIARRSGGQVGPSAALATSSGDSPVTPTTASTTRSRMRRPPSSTSPLGCPP